MWLESKVSDIVAQAARKLLAKSDYADIVDLCQWINGVMSALGEELAVEEALLLYDAVADTLTRASTKIDMSLIGRADISHDTESVVAIANLYLHLPMSLLLGLSRRASSIDDKALRLILRGVKWENGAIRYRRGLPRPVLNRLDYIVPRLETERKLGNKIVSPPWYIEQLAAAALVQSLHEAVEALLIEFEKRTTPEVLQPIVDQAPTLAAQIIDRGLEACHKMEYHIQEIHAAVERLTVFRKVTDILWVDLEMNELKPRIKAIHDRLLVWLSSIAPALASGLPPSLPDYFGQAYSTLANECFIALSEQDSLQFQRLFPAFFNTALIAHDTLNAGQSGLSDTNKLTLKSDVMLDLAAISGYAIAFDELWKTGLTTAVVDAWDNYLATAADPKGILNYLCATQSYRVSQFTLTSRSVARTTWQQHMEWMLRRAVKMVPSRSWGGMLSHQVAEHKSQLVRAVVGDGTFMIYSGEDVFMARYVGRRTEVQPDQLPRHAQSLIGRLAKNDSDELEEP